MLICLFVSFLIHAFSINGTFSRNLIKFKDHGILQTYDDKFSSKTLSEFLSHMAADLIVNLNVGQLASMIGIVNTLLPMMIGLIGATAVLMMINNEMTALEWTTISKLTQNSLLNIYGTGGNPALTGIKLWGVGSYRR